MFVQQIGDGPQALGSQLFELFSNPLTFVPSHSSGDLRIPLNFRIFRSGQCFRRVSDKKRKKREKVLEFSHASNAASDSWAITWRGGTRGGLELASRTEEENFSGEKLVLILCDAPRRLEGSREIVTDAEGLDCVAALREQVRSSEIETTGESERAAMIRSMQSFPSGRGLFPSVREQTNLRESLVHGCSGVKFE